MLLLLPALVFSCAAEKPSAPGVQPAQMPAVVAESSVSLEIVPADATRNSTLSLIVNGINPADAKIEWIVNGGKPFTTPAQHRLDAADLRRGDSVRAKATIKGSVVFSNEIKIKNTPPEMTKLKIMPEVFKPGDTLYIDAAAGDADGDKVTILYEWIKNGESASNDVKMTAPLKRGDRISVRITPFDEEAYGVPVVLHREIGNFPPVILENKKYDFDGIAYSYQIKASDQDNDTLDYSLKNAPPGMTVGKDTGLIKWSVPQEFTGKATFTAVVADGHGGEAAQNFILEIKPE